MQSRLRALFRPNFLFPRRNFVTARCLAQHTIPLRQASTLTSASTSTMVSETFGNFDLVKRVKLDYVDVEVSKYRSRVTGLNVVHLDYEGWSAFNSTLAAS